MKKQVTTPLNLLLVGIMLVFGSAWTHAPVHGSPADNSELIFIPATLSQRQLAVWRALQSPSDSVTLAQYNSMFLLPEDTPETAFDWLDHFPNSSERAWLIGKALACMDIVAFEEVSNDARREEIFESMEANGAECPGGRDPLIDGGTRYFDFLVGPHNSQTSPILDDEVAIASRFPIIEVHQTVFEDCSFIECWADKGVIHARIWRGPGYPASDAMDIFVTHLEAEDDSKVPAQLDQLAAFVVEHHDPAIPAVIMGDFNINGNRVPPHPNFDYMKAKLKEALEPDPQDAGAKAGETNLELTTRLDYILVSGADVTKDVTRVDCFEEFNTDALRQEIAKFVGSPPLVHGGLSDHCAVLSELRWLQPQVIPTPSVDLPREIVVEVSRLQEITPDVPDVLEIPTPVSIHTPFGDAVFPIRVLDLGCDGLTDHFGSLSITAGDVTTEMNFDEENPIEGDDITREPPWEARLEVPAHVAETIIDFRLEEEDDIVCGGTNDSQDINPFSDSKGITLVMDFNSNEVAVTTEAGRIPLASIGEPVILLGTDPDDRARTTLIIKSLYSATQDSDQDGLLDADEAYNIHTDLLDADSDDDELIDGDEVNVYGTDPLDANTDDDGLTDGDEVKVHGTSPMDADTDDDELTDGLEVELDMPPLNQDTDGDGISDGEDVEWLQNAIRALGRSAFKNNNRDHRTTILNRFNGIERHVAKGEIDRAIVRLERLRRHVDGCGSVPDRHDWIVDCSIQTQMRGFIDLLIANLSR